jgi:hypothetical protein
VPSHLPGIPLREAVASLHPENVLYKSQVFPVVWVFRQDIEHAGIMALRNQVTVKSGPIITASALLGPLG